MDNTFVMCGVSIPEGRQVCPACENAAKEKEVVCMDAHKEIDNREYARRMRNRLCLAENGTLLVSVELWTEIADRIERSVFCPNCGAKMDGKDERKG